MVDYVPERFAKHGIKTTVDGRVAEAFEAEMKRAGWTDRQFENALRWYETSGTKASKDPAWAATSFRHFMSQAGVEPEKIDAAIQIRERINAIGYMAFAFDEPAAASEARLIGNSTADVGAALPAPTPAGLLTGPSGE